MEIVLQSLVNRLRGARKILVVHMGAVGDTVHQLPACYLLHQNFPQAQIHFLASPSTASLFQLTPWISRVWLLPQRAPRGERWTYFLRALKLLCALRREKYDASVVFWMRNSHVVFSGLSGAPLRISGMHDANRTKSISWQKVFVNCWLDHPWNQRPWYIENWEGLKQMGLAGAQKPEFGAVIDPEHRRRLGLPALLDGGYIHLSPYSSQDRRDLPQVDLVRLIELIHAKRPELPWVISIAPSAREQLKLAEMLAALSFKPHLVNDSGLPLDVLVSVLAGAALQIGADSGGIHLALIPGIPVAAWFRPTNTMNLYLPVENCYVETTGCLEEGAVHGIDIERLAAGAVALLPGAV